MPSPLIGLMETGICRDPDSQPFLRMWQTCQGLSGHTGKRRTATLRRMEAPERDSFLESLMDTNLYSMGAYFCDQHPELVDEVIDQSVLIEREGIRAYADLNELSVEECFETLMTGLAVRYFKAVAT